MLKSMRDITREFFLGKYPFPIRNDRKKPKSLSLKPSLELLDQRIAPAVDAVAQLVGNGMGADQTPWYAIQGGPNGGTQFDVSEAFTGKDVYLGQGVSSLDIVGDEDQGSIYMAFDTASGGSVFNRMRIGDITAATYMQRAYVGMDFNTDGQVDLYTSANGSNTTVEILLPVDHDANPATIDNTSPENTAFAIYSSAAGVANNYAVTLVSASSDPQPGGTDIGSKADGNPDQFVSWKVALTDLDAAWKVVQTSRGIAPGSQTSLNQDSPFRIISFTFGSVTVEDPKLTDINGVTDFDGGSGPGANSDGFPIWDKGASPGPGIPAGLDVYSKSITLSCLVPPEIAPPFSFQMKEETTKFVTDVNITGSNTNPYMNFSISGTDAGDFSIDANSGVLTFKTLPDFEAPVDSNGDNIYSVSVTITNCVGSDTKLFTVEILDAGEFAPVAVDDSASTNEDVAITISALANDTDADVGQTATLVVGAYDSKTTKGGSVSLSPDGKIFNYTPALNFNGTDTFTYQAMDVDGKLSNLATVTITVSAVNDAPIAVDDSYSTNEDVVLTIAGPGVLGNDSDVDMDPLSAMLVSGPTNGVLVLNTDGSFTYTPNADFNGKDSFSYKANDGSLDSNIAKVTITVNAVNDAPIAVDDSYSTNEDVVLTIAGPGVLGNDSDVDMDPLSAVLVSGPSHGTLKLNVDGSFQYTPDLNYNGVDSFSYKANDGSLDSDIAMVTITVNPVNDPPVNDVDAAADEYDTNEDTPLVVAAPGVLINDVDVDGDPLSVFGLTAPAHGSIVMFPDGSFTYTPNKDFVGVDGFTYVVTDGELESNPIQVTITVNAVNDAPVAMDDSYSTNEDVVLTIAGPGVLGNDSDVDMDPLSAMLVSGPMHGTVTLNPDGSFNYTPNLDYNGVDSFSYKANDGSLDSNIAMVTITVDAVNDPPIIDGGESIDVSIPENTTFVTTVLASDVDMDPISYSISGGADGALFQIDPVTGVLSFIAAPDFETPLDMGADNIYDVQVMASDGMGGSATQSVHVTVLDVAEEGPPLVVVPIDFAENSTAPVVDLDAAGTGLTFAIVGGADASFFEIDPMTGVVSFKAPPDFEMPMDAGADNSYDLIVQATTLYGSDLQGLQVHVLDVPEIDDGGEPIVINYPENAVSPVVDVNVVGDNTGLTYSLSGPDAALFSIDADGVVSFLAPPDYEDPLDEGADNTYNITVHVSNSGGYSDSQDVVVNVLDLDEKVEAGPIQVIPDTGTYPDDNLTKAGNPLITFPGEEGLMFTLYGPDGTALIENEHYAVSYFEGDYSITLLDAYPGHDPVPDPDVDPFGTYLPDGTPSGNPDSTADGLYRLVAEDPSGNVAEVGTFEIDTTAPITGPIAIDPDTDPVGDLTTAAGNPEITFAGESGLTTFVVSFADPVTTLGVPLVEGSHYLLSSAEDTADIDGNPLTTTLYTITLLDANLAVPGDQPFGDYFEGIATGNPAFTGDGLYTVEASDIAGNTKAVGSFEIDTESAPPPVVDTIKYLATGNVPQGDVIGPSSVGTTVNIRNAISNDPFGAVTPFLGFDGEVRVAWADFNNDGFKDMVAGAGPGGGPHIKVIDAITGRELLSFFAFDPSFRGGVYVSADDVNSDGLADLVIGAGQGGGPHVRIFDGRTTNEIYSFFAYDVNFTGGVTVATYDYDKDGTLDIVTGAGPGGGPHVKVFDGVSREVIKQIMAYAPDFRGGVYVAAADFNGNLVPDIITGAGPGGGPHVKIINFETLQVVDEEMVFTNYTEPNGQVIDTLFGGGVRVALADGNGDGLLDLLCGAGPGGGPHVKIYAAGSKIREIASYFSGSPDDTSGVFVGG